MTRTIEVQNDDRREQREVPWVPAVRVGKELYLFEPVLGLPIPGPGGQGVNTADSAVRITHLPTNIVVSCQNERSQLRNRDTAMRILKARLFEIAEKKQKDELSQLTGAKKEIAFGSQIRTYTFHPEQRIKDHRTGLEIGNVEAVMDGEIDEFIKAYLLWSRGQQA